MKNKLIATSLNEIQKELKHCRWAIRSYSGDVARLLKKKIKAENVDAWAREISSVSESLGLYKGRKRLFEKLLGDNERFLSVQLFDYYDKEEKKK